MIDFFSHWLIPIAMCSYGGWLIAKWNASRTDSWWVVWIQGATLSLALAGWTAMTHSQPACVAYHPDPMVGGCVEYESEPPSYSAETAAQGVFFRTASGGTIALMLLRIDLRKRGISIKDYEGD